jgi:hypothetical protein
MADLDSVPECAVRLGWSQSLGPVEIPDSISNLSLSLSYQQGIYRPRVVLINSATHGGRDSVPNFTRAGGSTTVRAMLQETPWGS